MNAYIIQMLMYHTLIYKIGDIYMKNIFSYNSNINKNAYMNWRTKSDDPAHNLYIMASSYADGATALIDVILDDNKDKKADSLIMPIFYSIDQSIELYIKAIIRRIEEQLGEDISIYKEHDIKKLQSQMKGKIKKVEKKTAGLEKHLKSVSDYIDELYLKIKSSKTAAAHLTKDKGCCVQLTI